MSWITLALLSALFGSIARVLQKVLLSNKKGDAYALGFVFQTIVALIFLIYTLATNSLEFPNITDLWVNLIVMTIFYSLGNIFTFKAFKLADASEVAVIFSSSSIWAIISASVLLGERLKASNYLGILLIVSGIVVISITRSKWKLSSGHLYAVAGAFLFGVAFINDAYIIGRCNSIASYMIVAFTLPGIFTLFVKPSSIKAIPHYFDRATISKLIICCIIYSLSSITIFGAYKAGGMASIISPLQQLSIITTTILSYIFLKERNRIPNKIIGSVLAFIGAVLLI